MLTQPVRRTPWTTIPTTASTTITTAKLAPRLRRTKMSPCGCATHCLRLRDTKHKHPVHVGGAPGGRGHTKPEGGGCQQARLRSAVWRRRTTATATINFTVTALVWTQCVRQSDSDSWREVSRRGPHQYEMTRTRAQMMNNIDSTGLLDHRYSSKRVFSTRQHEVAYPISLCFCSLCNWSPSFVVPHRLIYVLYLRLHALALPQNGCASR
jgi:hypothetical protein